MEVFFTSFNQMLVMFTFILAGWILKRKHILSDNAGSLLSKLESTILLPALILNTFMNKCTLENLMAKSQLVLYCAVILVVITVFAYWTGKKFSKEAMTERIYRYSFIFSNFGFMGNALVLGIFGQDTLFDYMMFTIPLNIYTFSIGVSWLLPSEDGRFHIKSLCNPICFALAVGILLGITQVPLPAFLTTAISSTAACMSPIAMLLTGFIIGGYSTRRLLSIKKVYAISLLRLIVIPAAVVLVLQLLHTSYDIILVALCALAMPMGLNTIIFPAAYGGDTNLGASMELVSQALALVTIPVMFAVFL